MSSDWRRDLDAWLGHHAGSKAVEHRGRTLLRYPHLSRLLREEGEPGGALVVVDVANQLAITMDNEMPTAEKVVRYLNALLLAVGPPTARVALVDTAMLAMYLPPSPDSRTALARARAVARAVRYAGTEELELTRGHWVPLVLKVGVEVVATDAAQADLDDDAPVFTPKMLAGETDASYLPPMRSEFLTKVGFFRELPYGDRDGPSLRDSVGTLPPPDLPVAGYLRQGASIGFFPKSQIDVLHPSRDTPESVYVLTDGRYRWPSQLPYYVERYRVGLPDDLLQRARARGWTCPELSTSEKWNLGYETHWDYGGPAAAVFDAIAPGYDRDGRHVELARRLIAAMGPIDGSVVDVACGTGQVAHQLPTTVASILAVDASAGMVTHGRLLGGDRTVQWRTAPAVPLPVPDGSVDVILCSSALHYLGRAALEDWRRALRPGGRVGYTLPLPSRLPTSGPLAALLATDLPVPHTAADARQLAESAGLVDIEVIQLAGDTITTAATPRGR